MQTNRRMFLNLSGMALASTRMAATQRTTKSVALSPERARKALRILILGGTGFIGPHQVRYALARGHKVTLFNRGKTNPLLFPEVEKLQGDRAAGDYTSLARHEWDVVIDNPTTIPRWVRQAAQALGKRVGRYVFISTISVYAANDQPNADENADVLTTTEPESEDVKTLYGPLKALSEKEAQKAYPGRSTILRPGLIVGPGDPSDRFTYWPARLARGGEVLAPGDPTDPVQLIDARDLAEFTIRVCEEEITGVFNCTGPRSRLTISELLGAVRGVTTSDPYLTWVPASFLRDHKIRPWIDMPVWVPPYGQSAGFASRNISRALGRGFTFRPLSETAKDVLDFYNSEPEDRKAKPRAGLSPEKEREVLRAWNGRKKT